jgi:hypothetical protein
LLRVAFNCDEQDRASIQRCNRRRKSGLLFAKAFEWHRNRHSARFENSGTGFPDKDMRKFHETNACPMQLTGARSGGDLSKIAAIAANAD